MSNVSAIQKRQRIVNYIRSKRLFERGLVDTIELDSHITQDNTYLYLLAIIDHFSKYSFAYGIKNKKHKQLEITWHKLL